MAYVVPVPHLARTEAEPLLATIGNTPLLRLEKIPAEFPGIEIFAKAEYFNPGGSVKDRAALNMVLDGERSGSLNQSRTILDSTSGNTGIAYAMIGANRGYQVKLVPAGQRLRRAQAHSEGLRRGDGLQRCRRRLRRRHPPVPPDLHGRSRPLLLSRPVQQPGQLEGALRAHRRRRSSSRPAGASRTSSPPWAPAGRSPASPAGCKRDLPEVKCYSAQPSSGFHGLEGLKHMPTAIVPGYLRREPGRRQPVDRNRGRLPHGAAPGAGRGPAGGDFLGLQRACRHPAGARTRGARRDRRSS